MNLFADKFVEAKMPGAFCDQDHLGYSERVNLGSYYTGSEYVSIVWDFIRPFIGTNSVLLDSSCGYGNFLLESENVRLLGNDIDALAAETARKRKPSARIFNLNALTNPSRAAYGISEDEELIVVGNPPYNDKTSMVRNDTKRQIYEIDPDLASRDLGISFLRSYEKLAADYVCVLHPLSYLVKKANFSALGQFAKSYRLIDSQIISSGVFAQTSRCVQFPIIIALYKKDFWGMDYPYIESYKFRTSDKKSFSLNELDFIGNYLNKYPTKSSSLQEDDLFFFTMRDLNALKRNRTFVESYGTNTIIVDKKKLDYYIYADVVKDFSYVFPYYFGNLDVIINSRLFSIYRDSFIEYALAKHPFLEGYYSGFQKGKLVLDDCKDKILEYFEFLLGSHFQHSMLGAFPKS